MMRPLPCYGGPPLPPPTKPSNNTGVVYTGGGGGWICGGPLGRTPPSYPPARPGTTKCVFDLCKVYPNSNNGKMWMAALRPPMEKPFYSRPDGNVKRNNDNRASYWSNSLNQEPLIATSDNYGIADQGSCPIDYSDYSLL